ncbi:MAG: sensor domain-containing diguanylate cyclase, partial [Candidatus Mariimomonas ferrooxydans]
KIEELLNSVSDLSMSIAPILNWEQLVQTILEKLIQLLKAEQGSLMLLNQETDELLVEAKINIDKLEREGIRVRRGEGIAGKVLENGEPLLVEDLEKDPRIKQKNKPRYKTKSFVSIPIRIDGRMSGIFNMSDKISGEAFDKNDLKLIQAFIANAAIAIERSLMYKKNKKLKQLSLTDPLTGALNRRYLDNRLYEEIARYGRYKNPFSLLMVDIDGFKEYNDTFGHIAGDNTLKTITTTIISSLRDIDILTRFGGDEFVVILPQTPKTNAINIANRTKDSVEKDFISPKQKLPSHITISIGLSSYPDDASSATELLAKADEALYIAKKKGGNKLVYF